jgi:hypothetical protein
MLFIIMVCLIVGLAYSFTQACHALPFYDLRAGHPRNGLRAVSGVARPHGGPLVAVFYPFENPTPHAHMKNQL